MTVTAIDIFAGAGGFSVGAEKAGVKVLFAVNHWAPAVWTQEQNKKRWTKVLKHNVFEYDWAKAPDVDIVLASPACQGHSNAATKGLKEGRRGTAPRHNSLRATAQAVPRCLEMKRPAFALVENVVEFLDWVGYRGWRAYMEDLGYHLAEHVIDCADFGVPSHRARVFITAVRHDHSRVPFHLKVPKKRHTGAIIMGSTGIAESKIDAFTTAGVPIAEKPSDIAKLLTR